MDPNSLSAGYVAALAVSGSVVLLALQVHKRLLSNFMKQMEFEIGYGKHHEQQKKKVRFADGGAVKKKVMATRKKRNQHRCSLPEQKLEAMPRNWQALYKGILQNKALKSLP